MCDFEWTGALSNEEENALRGYKDNTWIQINPGLRCDEDLADELQQQVQLLDRAIRKGRCTRTLILFRATGLNCLRIEGEVITGDKAFLSTSLRDDGLGSFFEDPPVKLIIECPMGTVMAAFEHDDAGGEEQERLLPRETRFRIKSQRTILNRLDPCAEEGPYNRFYMQLPRCAEIITYTVEPMNG